MSRRFFFLWLACAASIHAAKNTIPQITPAAAGPYHVHGNRIVDSKGNDYLIRGTQLPVIALKTSSKAPDFGAFSGTTFVTIRQRINMNAVRLPVDPVQFEASEAYRVRVKEVVQLANRFELLAILEARPEPASDAFWTQLAAEFKTNPNVFFAASTIESLGIIRSAGAGQPVIVSAESAMAEPDLIYQVSPSYVSLKTKLAELGSLSETVPVLANGLDPQLDRKGSECAAFPAEPSAATRLMEEVLNYFDDHAISWTISSVEPGRLVDNLHYYDWRKLDDGWTCGESPAHAGIAMVLLSHLWRADPHGIFTVNQPAGGLIVARGANSSCYGRTLAEREALGSGFPLPVKLGDVSVRVTDSQGTARLAPLSWVGGGWSNINFVVPEETAPGAAEVAVIRADGSTTTSMVIVADVAPAFWTATHDGRGPVIGQVIQRLPGGKPVQFPAWECSKSVCRAAPIPLAKHVSTTVRLEGTGFRFASSRDAIHVTIDGVEVPVESFGPMPGTSRDQVTIQLPDELIGHGEGELLLTVDGALSNVVVINCGRKP